MLSCHPRTVVIVSNGIRGIRYIQGGGGGQPLLLQEKKMWRYSRGIKQGSRVREVVLLTEESITLAQATERV
jgi:hypothetical protein